MHTRRIIRPLALILVLLTAAFAREPLSIDQGKTGLQLTLRKLHTTARLMHTAAHPDDEDGGMLTLESRGRGVSVVQMTLTRGEGGQNAVGKELGDELGMLRTLELLEADRYYGVEQRFSRVADFGFSKTADETLKKWDARNTALPDLVRVIRELKPDVIISRFIGDSSDGHGNHQASGILTREAFRAAGDPTKFPEQIKEGLQVWQAKKLYVRARGDDWNVELNVTLTDPLLGMNYVAWGFQGLKHQLSQGSANWQAPTRMFTSHYKLADTTIPNYKPAHEKDFFDGIDTSLLGLTNSAPSLKPGLQELTSLVDEASNAADKDPKSAAVPLLRGFAKTKELIEQVKSLPLSASQKQQLTVALEAKRDEFRDAANFALGVTLSATAELPATKDIKDPAARMWRTATTETTVSLGIKGTIPMEVSLEAKGSAGRGLDFVSGHSHTLAAIVVEKDARYTRQYWHRDYPDRESIYTIDDPQFATLSLTPWPFTAHGTYEYQGLKGEVVTTVEVPTPKTHPLIVGPAWSIATPSWTIVRSAKTDDWSRVPIDVRPNIAAKNVPDFSLRVPYGWKASTDKNTVSLNEPGVEKRIDALSFEPATTTQQRSTVTAYATVGGSTFDVSYKVVTRDDLGTAYYFRKATQPVSIVDVKIPAGLRVGYIMGAGDDIPDVLKSVGVNVTLLSPEEVKSGDLSKYSTIVLGIRAHEAREDVRQNNQRLLDYVKNGGTLMVQYVYQTDQFSSGNYTPYPLSLDRNNRDRVTVEEAPVEILAPSDPIFQSPNQISQKDFDGWVQERALYCPTQWDSHYTPLLSSHDPGDPAERGGVLVAKYGKGTYIFNAWAFFRQLPAGVPGAIRLYVNLLNAGHGN